MDNDKVIKIFEDEGEKKVEVTKVIPERTEKVVLNHKDLFIKKRLLEIRVEEGKKAEQELKEVITQLESCK